MKKNILVTNCIFFIINVTLLIINIKPNNTSSDIISSNKITHKIIYDTIRSTIDKSKLVEAFIQVESTGNNNAVNKYSKASGCLQLMPIMVEDANRISGKNYSLDDRFDRNKSIEMFHIIMEYYNPTYDLHYACKLWNPKSSIGYHRAIEKEYNKLIN